MSIINDSAVSTLARKIKTARTIADMKQEDLAREVGVSRSAVGQWEKGETEPSASKLMLIAHATNQPLGWFAEGLIEELCARRDSNSQPSDLEPEGFWTMDRALVFLEFYCQESPDTESLNLDHLA